jgi:hypothetical protein
MASTNMSARSSPKSAASSAGGCGRRQSSNASVTHQGRRGALRPGAARFVYAPGGCTANPADRMRPRHPTKLHRIPPAVTNRTCRHHGDRRWMWDEHTGRKPLLLLRLSGWLLLRFAARALSGLLFQPPPRNTRGSISGHPYRLPGAPKLTTGKGPGSKKNFEPRYARFQWSAPSAPAFSGWGTNTRAGSRNCSCG